MARCTDVTLLLDRSGSMKSCKDAMEEAINGFLVDQRQLPGQCLFSLVMFDDKCEPVERMTGIPIADTGEVVIEPRGGTALRDAMAKTIAATEKRIRKMPEESRPDKVLFVIVTDGQDNVNPQECGWPEVQRAVKRMEELYHWDFLYLGANQDAIATACQAGIHTGNTMNFDAQRGGAKGLEHTRRAMSLVGTKARRGAGGQSCSSNLAAYESDNSFDETLAEYKKEFAK